MYKHQFVQTIMRSYDIRGVFEKTLNVKDAFMLGFFFGITAKDQNQSKEYPLIIIGMDGRLSSPILEENLCRGLEEAGCEVYRIGLGPTPMLYFASHYFNADGAIQITGSHNPKNYNGFKIVLNQKPFFGQDIQNLGLLAQKGFACEKKGSSKKVNINEKYIEKLIEPLKKISKSLDNKTLVWDCGNGACGPSIESITRNLPGKHIILYSDVDGNFPNHHPDPTDVSTLETLSQKMKEANADLGIAFDGDGDRIGVMDKNGLPVPGDLLTAFLANSIKDKVNKTVILDIKSSNVAYEKIMSLGFNAEIGKTGHSNIKKRIKEINAPLAGEMSGHIFFADNYFGFDDAIYASIRLIELLANDITLHEFISSLPVTYPSREIKVYCPDNVKFKTMENISNEVLKNYNSKDIITIDGIRAKNKFGWWLIRASNTEEALVVRFEGNSAEDKNELFNEVKYLLNNEGLTLETI